MGVDYKAAVIVGLPRREFEDYDQLQEWLNNEDLECCPPYYDGCGAASTIIGKFMQLSGDYKPAEFNYSVDEVESMKNEFKLLTGKEAKIWISPYGY